MILVSRIVLCVVFFDALSWVVLLGGLASLQEQCNQVSALYYSPYGCNADYSFSWWVLFFQLFVLLWACAATCAPERGLQGATPHLVTMVTAVLMWLTQYVSGYLKRPETVMPTEFVAAFQTRLRTDVPDASQASEPLALDAALSWLAVVGSAICGCCYAGLVMSTIFNFFILFIITWRPNVDSTVEQQPLPTMSPHSTVQQKPMPTMSPPSAAANAPPATFVPAPTPGYSPRPGPMYVQGSAPPSAGHSFGPSSQYPSSPAPQPGQAVV